MLCVRQALKTVGTDKSPGIDGLPYEVYLRLSPMFFPSLTTIYNNLMKQGTIPQCFIKGIVKLPRKDKHGGYGISNFRSLTMLNTDLEILVKILADYLQTARPSLISPQQSCPMKDKTIQDNLHMVRLIIKKVDGNATLINLDQSKAFDRLTTLFLSFATGFAFSMRPQSHDGSERDEIEALGLFVKVIRCRPCCTSLCWNQSLAG